jgi:hypothetical protein
MKPARALFACLAATAVIGSSAAEANDSASPFLQLQWEAPGVCPAAAQVLAEIQAMIGDRDVQRGRRARVVLAEDGTAGWHAVVELPADPGHPVRTLRGETCRAVADATVVVLAVALGGERAPPKPAPAPKPRLEPAPADLPRGAWGAGLAGVVESGTLPKTALGLAALGVWNVAPSLRLEAELSALAPRSTVMPDRPWEGAEFWAARVGLRACGAIEFGVLAGGPCAGVGLDRIAGNGFGAQIPMDATANRFVFQAGGVGLLTLGSRWRLRLGLSFVIPARRQPFVIEGAGTVHRPSAVSVQIGVGPEVRF